MPITIVFNKKIQYLYKVDIKENEVLESFEKWCISIPNINLYAPIADGVDEETLNNYVGHFYQGGYALGNVSLAAHNRGFPINYFANLKYLKLGDEIFYEYKNLKLRYEVSNIKIISDTDVNEIENTKENKITLITCVEDMPEKRRCIKGILRI